MTRPGNNTVGAPNMGGVTRPTNTPSTTPTAEPPNSAAPGPPPQSSGSMTESQWAALLLQNVGAPVTQNNIDNILRWMTAEEPTQNWYDRNNPLNASVGTGTVDGTGSYADLQSAAQYTAGMINQNNMAGIKQALMENADPNTFSAAVVASPWASSHYGGDPNHIAQIGTPGGRTPAPASVSTGPASNVPTQGSVNDANGTVPAPPGINDIPALDAYIRQNFGTDAWLLDIPDVKNVLENAVAKQESTAQIQAAIEQTQWWKTTSQAVKNYQQDSANNPADYSFTNPGSKASQALAQVNSTAGQNGVVLDPHTAQNLAQNFLQYGWTTQQLQQAIGSHASAGNATSITQQLQNMAMQYYMPVSTQSLTSWAQNIAAGTQSLGQFQAQMANDAAQKWTGFAPQLQSGSTMQQLTDSLRTEAAKTMEVDPNSINFLNDPMYSKILDYVPPNSPNGVHRVMTLSEMNQYLKSTKPYGYTQGARDSAASLEQAITTSFGKVG